MLGDSTDASKVVANVDEIARRLEEFEIEASISDEALDSTMEISSDDLTAAMQEIDIEAGLADASAVKKPLGEIESLEEDIKSLERELGI